MDVKADDRKGKEELILEFFELELRHLLKSGNENPKITEHFMKRVREFMELPEDMTFPTIVLGDVESMRNLAGVISRLKTDINYIEDRVNKLKQELGQMDRPDIAKSAAPSGPPSADITPPDDSKRGPKMP